MARPADGRLRQLRLGRPACLSLAPASWLPPRRRPVVLLPEHPLPSRPSPRSPPCACRRPLVTTQLRGRQPRHRPLPLRRPGLPERSPRPPRPPEPVPRGADRRRPPGEGPMRRAGTPRRRAPWRGWRSWLHQRTQIGEPAITDPGHLTELIHRGEPTMSATEFDDVPSEHRAHTGEGVELRLGRRAEADRRTRAAAGPLATASGGTDSRPHRHRLPHPHHQAPRHFLGHPQRRPRSVHRRPAAGPGSGHGYSHRAAHLPRPGAHR